MKLSFQTVCIVFGVTLAHLVAIAALSPGDGGGAGIRRSPIATVAIPEFDEEADPLPADHDQVEEAPFERSEAFDPPARRREDALTPATKASEPVAESQAVPPGAAVARPFAPLPRS